jgi:hypothetical protein
VAVGGTALPATATATAMARPDVTPAKVAATRFGDAHAVYLRGTDGLLRWRTVEDTGSPGLSTAWRSIPGAVASGPDALEVSPEHVVLAARSVRSTLVVRSQARGSFAPWEDLGGELTSAPVLVRDDNARIWAFVRWSNGTYRYRVRNTGGGWGIWRGIGGAFTSAPDAVSNFGQIRVWGRGTDGVTRLRALDLEVNAWEPWRSGGNTVTSATSTVESDVTFQVQYFRGARNHVYAMFGDSPAFDLGGAATAAPDAAYGGEVVAIRGTDNAMWARVDGGPWQSLGGRAT